jgi:ABC-type nitrate/sulfonate/bicarbonate transport system permease component
VRAGDALRRTLLVVALPAVLLTAWWVLSASSTNIYAPPLSQIVEQFRLVWLEGGRFTADVLPSLGRLAAGYALAVALGVGLGVALGSSRTARQVFEPLLELFRAVPAPVLIPVLILLTGIGTTQKVLVIASGCIWPVLLNTVEGVRATDGVLSDTCRSYGITGSARLRHLVLRSASPQIVTGMRQALSIAVILMVISEMFASDNGIGYAVLDFQRSFAIPEMWSGILLLGVLGVLLSLLFRVFEGRVLGWYAGLRRAQRDG